MCMWICVQAMLHTGMHQPGPAVAALAVMTQGNEAVSRGVLQGGGTPGLVEALHSRSRTVRLHAAQSLVQLVHHSCLPKDESETVCCCC